MFSFFRRYPESEIHFDLRDREEDVLGDLRAMFGGQVITEESYKLLHKMVGQTFLRFHEYAHFGKNRKRLGMEIGERAETRAREMIEYYIELAEK